jgi:hypothetical protein
MTGEPSAVADTCRALPALAVGADLSASTCKPVFAAKPSFSVLKMRDAQQTTTPHQDHGCEEWLCWRRNGSANISPCAYRPVYTGLTA